MTDSDGIRRLRQLATRRNKLSAEIDDATEAALRDGEFVGEVADALGVSRETIRRFRESKGIPDARDIRAQKGEPRLRGGKPPRAADSDS